MSVSTVTVATREPARRVRYSALRHIIVLSILPAGILAGIWFPAFRYFHIATPEISPEVVERSRIAPDDGVLDRLTQINFTASIPISENSWVSEADDVIRGNLQLPSEPLARVTLPFAASDLRRTNAGVQLELASLIVPRILLKAYEKTGNHDYLDKARDSLLAWAEYDRQTSMTEGFLWNDHAVASRVPVLTDFWRDYRHDQSYDPAVARKIFAFVARTGELLAKPDHYTYATNHGVMQNLALLHLRLAFPQLPGANAYSDLALQRLNSQMKYYVDTNGAILEHSAGYQAFGVRLFSYLQTYLDLLHAPVPPDWAAKFQRASLFYSQLRRPDGTLPMFGDTDGGADPFGPFSASDSYSRDWTIDPIAGYAIGWDSNEDHPAAQTVATWAYTRGMGHKHADELSVMLWAGRTWVGNVGYWPYWLPGRSDTEGWNGSDAPHLDNEPATSDRTSRLLGYYSSTDLTLLDVERTGPGQFHARRQIVHLRPDFWLVLDSSESSSGQVVNTTWNLGHGIELAHGQQGAYAMSANGTAERGYAWFAGPESMTVQQFEGSMSPFAGWQVVGKEVLPAPAIRVQYGATHGWSAAMWELGVSGSVPNAPAIQWQDSTHWRLVPPGHGKASEIDRRGDEIVVKSPDGKTASFTETRAEPADDAQKLITSDLNRTALEYPVFRPFLRYRRRLTAVVVAAWALQTLLLVAFVFLDMRKQLRTISNIAIACLWVMGGAWVFLRYLR